MIYQRSYDKFINGGCPGQPDFLYIKDTYSNYVISANYKRLLETAMYLVINAVLAQR